MTDKATATKAIQQILRAIFNALKAGGDSDVQFVTAEHDRLVGHLFISSWKRKPKCVWNDMLNQSEWDSPHGGWLMNIEINEESPPIWNLINIIDNSDLIYPTGEIK